MMRENGFELKVRIVDEKASIEMYQNPEGIWMSYYRGMLKRSMVQEAALAFIKETKEFKKTHPDTPQPVLFYFSPDRLIIFGLSDIMDLKEAYIQMNGGSFVVIEMDPSFATIIFNTVLLATRLLPGFVSQNQIYTLNYLGRETAGLEYARQQIEQKKRTTTA